MRRTATGLLAAASAAVAIDLLPFGRSLGDAAAQRADDECAPVLAIPRLRVWNGSYTSAYVSINGVLSFGSCVTAYVPQPFPIRGNAILAPFWADVDTRTSAEYPVPSSGAGDPAEPDNVPCTLSVGAARQAGAASTHRPHS